MFIMNEHTNDTQENPNQEMRLVNVLYSLESQIQRQNSLKFTLLKGMVYGLGTVLGATVLVALFGSILAGFINSIIGQEVISEALIEKQ